MAVEYGLIILVFFPLFIAFIRMLKRSFSSVYNKMKVRSSLAFAAFMLVLIFRYVVYSLI